MYNKNTITETRADLEWELWMMDMMTDSSPETEEYRRNRRNEIKLKLAEMDLVNYAKRGLLTNGKS